MKVLLVFAAVLAAVSAYNGFGDGGFGPLGGFHGYHGPFNHGFFDAPFNFFNFRGLYYGNYHGECPYDGFYYKDADSFYICSNGVAHVQRCAPGSINSNSHYVYGQHYTYSDFCDVNLNDQRL